MHRAHERSGAGAYGELMTTASGALQSWVAEGTDLDDARALYQDQYNGLDFLLEPTEEPFSYRLSSIGDDELSLRSNTVHARMRGTYMVSGQYLATWFTAGEGTLDVGRDEVTMVAGEPVMSVRDRPSRFHTRDHRQSLMHFGSDFLEHAAAERDSTRPGPLRFDTARSPSPQLLRSWMSVVTRTARVLYSPDASPLLIAAAKHEAAHALLQTFTYEPGEMTPGYSHARGVRLRHAVDFVRAHAHLPITTEQIADAAGLSVRGVQESFRRTLGVAPLEFLREVRLERVHEELLNAERGRVTVSDVARNWGFVHLGRFAGTYAERFGESPNRTLRRSTAA